MALSEVTSWRRMAPGMINDGLYEARTSDWWNRLVVQTGAHTQNKHLTKTGDSVGPARQPQNLT